MARCPHLRHPKDTLLGKVEYELAAPRLRAPSHIELLQRLRHPLRALARTQGANLDGKLFQAKC